MGNEVAEAFNLSPDPPFEKHLPYHWVKVRFLTISVEILYFIFIIVEIPSDTAH